MPFIQAERFLKGRLGHFWYLQQTNIEKLLRAEDLMFILDGKEICPLECRRILGLAHEVCGGRYRGEHITVKEKYMFIGHDLKEGTWCIEAYGHKEAFPIQHVYVFQAREEEKCN